jgi:hypothetical protein
LTILFVERKEERGTTAQTNCPPNRIRSTATRGHRCEMFASPNMNVDPSIRPCGPPPSTSGRLGPVLGHTRTGGSPTKTHSSFRRRPWTPT